MTPAQLHAATSCGLRTATLYAAVLDAAMDEFEVTTRYRKAAFLAQTGHESMGFLRLREIWGPTTAQMGYEGRKDLGNTARGDGFFFRGRGFLQITGRANYAACAAALELPLIDHPEILEQPEAAARSAGWFWSEVKHLNSLADQQLFSAITRRINGGTNGAEDRLRRYHLALDNLG